MRLEHLALHDALLQGVSLGPRRELLLDIFVPDVTTATERRGRPGQRVFVRFGGIENYANVERFFFGGPLKGRDDCLDRIEGMKQTRVGWSLELDTRGRVAIKTRKPPSVESEEAGEQADAADEVRAGSGNHGLRR